MGGASTRDVPNGGSALQLLRSKSILAIATLGLMLGVATAAFGLLLVLRLELSNGVVQFQQPLMVIDLADQL